MKNIRHSPVSKPSNKETDGTSIDGSQSVSDEDIIVNILPSYEMYRNQVSRNLTPSADNFRICPPLYQRNSSDSVVFGDSSSESESVLSPQISTRVVDNDAPATLWEDSVLANTPKLRRLFKEFATLEASLKLQIQLTEGLAKIGEPPKLVDPLYKEFQQGDYVNGYVTIENTSDKHIPFEMFDVVFDGVSTMDDEPGKEPYVTKFINMLDFNALWNDAYLNRLTTENRNPHGPCPYDAIDPIDNCMTLLDSAKVFYPGVKYKKFFTFKIPQKMLDSTCVPHRLVKHLQLPPTFGMSSYEIGQGKQCAAMVEDFSFKNTSIGYSLSARVISKASDFSWLIPSTPNERPDEYVIIRETNTFLRFIPYKNKLFRLNEELILEESRLVYKNIIWNLDECMKKWDKLAALPDKEEEEEEVTSRTPVAQQNLTKLRQLYPKVETTSSNMHEVITNYQRKSMIGTKTIGVLSLSAPKRQYKVTYSPMPKYSKIKHNLLEIPLEVNFMYSDNKTYTKAPCIKTISAELVACTIVSKKKRPIPVVITHDLLFENDSTIKDDFQTLTIARFQKYALRLNAMMRKAGFHTLDLDLAILDDVKCLSNLKCKYDSFGTEKCVDVVGENGELLIESTPWNTVPSANETKYTKRFKAVVDILKFKHNQISEFNLVPEFQTCSLARLYFLKLIVNLPNGSKSEIKVPVFIQKDAD